VPTLTFKIKLSTSVFSSKGFFCGEFILPCNIHRKHHITSNLQKYKLAQMGTLMLLKKFTLLFLLISASLLSTSFAGGSF